MKINPEETSYNGSSNLYTQGFDSELNIILMDLLHNNNSVNFQSCKRKIEDVYVQYCEDIEGQKYKEKIQKDLSLSKITALKNLENFKGHL